MHIGGFSLPLHRDMKTSDSIIIIPTYNEKENIEKIIRTIFSLEKSFHILVVDDGSPDGTASIVKGLMAQEFSDSLFILERSGKLGLGTAYITGFKWALEHGYDYVFETPMICLDFTQPVRMKVMI